MKNQENKAKNIGDRIRSAREEEGYSQADLAKAIGFETPTAISLIESGDRKLTAENLELISKTLHRPVGYFLGIEEKMPDVKVALRASKDIDKKDQDTILKIIEMAKKKYGEK